MISYKFLLILSSCPSLWFVNRYLPSHRNSLTDDIFNQTKISLQKFACLIPFKSVTNKPTFFIECFRVFIYGRKTTLNQRDSDQLFINNFFPLNHVLTTSIDITVWEIKYKIHQLNQLYIEKSDQVSIILDKIPTEGIADLNLTTLNIKETLKTGIT